MPTTSQPPPVKVTLRRLYALAWPERVPLGVGAIFLLLATAGALAFPHSAGKLFDSALLYRADNQVDLAKVDTLAVWLIVIFAGTAVASALRFLLFARTGERVVSRLRTDLYAALLKQETAFFDGQKVGELSSRLTSDAGILQTTVSGSISMLLRNFTTVAGALVMLFFISTRLTLSMLTVVPPIALGAVIYGKRVRRLSRQVQDSLAKANDVAVEALGGIRTVKSFAAETVEATRYHGAIQHALSLAFRRIRLSATFLGISSFAAFGAGVFVFWYGARQVAEGALTAGSLISFLFYTMQVAFGTGALAEVWTDVQRASGAAERIFELLDRKPAIPEAGVTLSSVEGRITFSNVTFAYPTRPQHKVLDGFNFELSPGEITAVVGPSGAGKSTIAALIYRLYDPQSGTLRLDGRLYESLSPHFLRRQVGVVAQEPLLFSTSISENIRYGKPGATAEEIEAAARAANAHDYISKFPDGYATTVGERGVQLSGGQKQRVAIARAVLKDPRILILDEATSALDAESEALVQDALARLMQGRTTLIIAHRLSTVRDAQRVVVMENGRLVQVGTHASLVSVDGLYRRLIERQFAA